VSSLFITTWLNLTLHGHDPIGWSGVVNDLRYWSTHNICRMRSGALFALLSLLMADFSFVDLDLHRPQTIASCKCRSGDFEGLIASLKCVLLGIITCFVATSSNILLDSYYLGRELKFEVQS